ncbi:MAG: carboxypeptidase regulatory-like domain-containing protein, partial [Terriglobia bacterium]
MKAQSNSLWRACKQVFRFPATLALIFTLAAVLPVSEYWAQSPAANQPLQVTISAAQPAIAGSFSIVLHFHNSGSQPLWLYRPAAEAGDSGENPGGSTLATHLEPATSVSLATPAIGTVLRVPGFPHPELFSIEPRGSQDETVAIYITPGAVKSAGGTAPYWGAYQLSVDYSASYPNGDSIRKNLGVALWSGSVASNSTQIMLAAPGASDDGMISGKTLDHDGRMAAGILVSLTDDHERLLQQIITGNDGGFWFDHLPFGRYWVTVRRLGADQDTSFFEHADLSASGPDAQLKLVMLNETAYQGKQMLHKPVLVRVSDGSGAPVADAGLAILWTDGSVTESEKIEANEGGLAATTLIPGTNYVTVSKRHCPKEDQTAEIAPGGGIDSFSITYD